MLIYLYSDGLGVRVDESHPRGHRLDYYTTDCLIPFGTFPRIFFSDPSRKINQELFIFHFHCLFRPTANKLIQGVTGSNPAGAVSQFLLKMGTLPEKFRHGGKIPAVGIGKRPEISLREIDVFRCMEHYVVRHPSYRPGYLYPFSISIYSCTFFTSLSKEDSFGCFKGGQVSSLGRYVFGSEISYNKAPPRLPGLAC